MKNNQLLQGHHFSHLLLATRHFCVAMGKFIPRNYTNRKVAAHFLHDYPISLLIGFIDKQRIFYFVLVLIITSIEVVQANKNNLCVIYGFAV